MLALHNNCWKGFKTTACSLKPKKASDFLKRDALVVFKDF